MLYTCYKKIQVYKISSLERGHYYSQHNGCRKLWNIAHFLQCCHLLWVWGNVLSTCFVGKILHHFLWKVQRSTGTEKPSIQRNLVPRFLTLRFLNETNVIVLSAFGGTESISWATGRAKPESLDTLYPTATFWSI